MTTNNNIQHDYNKAKEEARRLKIELIKVAEENFQNSRSNFVKLDTGYFNKEQLVSIRFTETAIHARFSTGDIVSISEEQLLELTS